MGTMYHIGINAKVQDTAKDHVNCHFRTCLNAKEHVFLAKLATTTWSQVFNHVGYSSSQPLSVNKVKNNSHYL